MGSSAAIGVLRLRRRSAASAQDDAEQSSVSVVNCHLSAGRSSFCRRVEVIIGRVAALHFGVLLCGITVGSRGRLAALGVNSLDGVDSAEHPFAGMAGNRNQQPGNRVRVGRIGLGDGLPGNLAAVVAFPCGSGKVMADHRPLLVMKLCVGRFEDPGKMTVRCGLTHVDLRAGSVGNKDNLLARRSIEFLGHVGAGDGLSAGVSSDSDKSGEEQWSRHHAQEFTTVRGVAAVGRTIKTGASYPLRPLLR